MTWWTAAWLIWIGLFVVIELAALLNKQPGDTLSEHAWAWFSIKSKSGSWRIRRFILLAFMAWLTVHFLTGGWV